MADLLISDLTVEYASGGYIVRPIDRLNLEARSGELVLLLGPSGCGKTTLLSCLAGILTPAAGRIVFGDVVVTDLAGEGLTDYRRRAVGIVFQAFNLIPSLSALENVQASLLGDGGSLGSSRERARTLLERVGLADRTHHKPSDLSGGQQQRVAIARALAHDPSLLLADEPTAHLDYVQVEGVLRLIRDLARPGRLVVVATHDERIVPLADRVVELAPKARDARTGPKRVSLARGELLFEQGARADLIFVVESGEIALSRLRADGAEEVVDEVGPGGYFGELGPLLGYPRAATARAKTAASVTGYSVRDFRDMVGPERLAELIGRAGATRPSTRAKSRPRPGRSSRPRPLRSSRARTVKRSVRARAPKRSPEGRPRRRGTS